MCVCVRVVFVCVCVCVYNVCVKDCKTIEKERGKERETEKVCAVWELRICTLHSALDCEEGR